MGAGPRLNALGDNAVHDRAEAWRRRDQVLKLVITMGLSSDERRIVLSVAAVQFINVLDFVMVAPLAGDFALALSIPTSQIGFVSGSYTAAAGLSGLVGSVFWDRFERKRALVFCALALAFATLTSALAVDFQSLVAARVFAGIFGGPATALSVAIVTDAVPIERRGQAMGVAMAAFSVASIVGVPLALKLSELGSWRTPFVAVGLLAFVVAAAAWCALPTMRDHIRVDDEHLKHHPLGFLVRGDVWLAYLLVGCSMTAGFMIIPNITAYVLFNLGYPRSHLKTLYCVGGLLSLIGMQVAGGLIDRIGVFPVGAVAIGVVVAVIYLLFIGFNGWIPLLPLFALFMMCMSIRAVAQTTLTSQVPRRFERARFMSLQSATQHLGSSSGAFVSSMVLAEGANNTLVGIDTVSLIAIGLFVLVPVLMKILEDRSRATRERIPGLPAV